MARETQTAELLYEPLGAIGVITPWTFPFTGSVWTNDVSYSYGTGQAAWGGMKESGFGRTHSRHGLYELSRVKFADLDRGRVAVPWWFPYGEGAVEGFRGMAGVLYGEGLGRKLGAAWRHRRGLLDLGRRYLSRL